VVVYIAVAVVVPGGPVRMWGDPLLYQSLYQVLSNGC
jgi:hypothetical protein